MSSMVLKHKYIAVNEMDSTFALGLSDSLITSGHFVIQSEVKPKPVVTRVDTFSRALRRCHVFALSFDWFSAQRSITQ